MDRDGEGSARGGTRTMISIENLRLLAAVAVLAAVILGLLLR
jgi:hypothetical protein